VDSSPPSLLKGFVKGFAENFKEGYKVGHKKGKEILKRDPKQDPKKGPEKGFKKSAERRKVMNVLIGMPVYEMVCPECFKSIYGQEVETGANYYFDYIKGYGVQVARNKLIKLAIDYKMQYLLFVDSDIILPSNFIKTCLKHIDKSPIVSGWYPKQKSLNGATECYFSGKSPEGYDFTNIAASFIEKRKDKGAFEVKGVGLGCAFVDIEKIKADYKASWLEYKAYDNGSVLSEDLNFCLNVTKTYKTSPLVIPELRCGHISRITL
jgi:glycosyltransferase involved in cell wall biosynthesis